jgi:hypothetical protein
MLVATILCPQRSGSPINLLEIREKILCLLMFYSLKAYTNNALLFYTQKT